MDISLDWLRGCLDGGAQSADGVAGLSAEGLAARLTGIGLEVEGLRDWCSHPGGLEGLVVGLVLEAEAHPDADRLKVTRVDVGPHAEGPLPIVCGAPNVAAGQKVIVALVGTTLHPTGGEPFTIKKAKIRGQVSEGMICAEDEIGTGKSHEGILVLPADTPVGMSAAEVFGVRRDTILEIGLTPNRADANSHLGVARDLAAALNADGGTVRVAVPQGLPDPFARTGEPFPVTVETPEACPRYAGVLLEGVTVGPSPDWLRQRLEAIGVKAINNVVDVTNYVLHHWGQPLHAFDADRLRGGRIAVRTWPEGTPFMTLDGDERKLRATDLTISDAEGPVCLAGIYGGLGSGVTAGTTRVFLESATFDPLWIRRSASAHGLRTDAAAHFEKGTDPNAPPRALAHAVALLGELAGARPAAPASDHYPAPVEPAEVLLRWSRLDRLVGEALPRERVTRILDALGMAPAATGEGDDAGLRCRVPTDKTDVTREADLIEEVLRLHGMDRVGAPATIRSNLSAAAATDAETLRHRTADFLVGRGFREAFTNPITRGAYLKAHWPSAPAVPLANSLNAELDTMRPSLVFGALEVVAWNAKRQRDFPAGFEFGRVFAPAPEGAAEPFTETEHLALWMSGRAEPESWRGGRDAVDYIDLKGAVTALAERLGLPLEGREDLDRASLPWMAWGEAVFTGGEKILTFGRLDPGLEKAFDLRRPVFYAAFDWDAVLRVRGGRETVFRPVSRMPAVRRDLALVLPRETRFADVEAAVRRQAGPLLRHLVLFDAYEGDRLEAGRKSYGIGLSFRDDKATLTDKQVDKVMQRIIRHCETELQAAVRR